MSSPEPSLRVFLPRHLASIRLRFHCLLSQSTPEGGRHFAGGTCSALRVTAGSLVLGGCVTTRESRLGGFLGRQLAQLCACPCTRLGYVQNNLAACGGRCELNGSVPIASTRVRRLSPPGSPASAGGEAKHRQQVGLARGVRSCGPHGVPPV